MGRQVTRLLKILLIIFFVVMMVCGFLAVSDAMEGIGGMLWQIGWKTSLCICFALMAILTAKERRR
jgi:hypothetical protein